RAAAPPAAPAQAASASEDPMDKLRRRLGEAMGGGSLQADSPGELRLTTRTSSPAAAGAAQTATAARHTTAPGGTLPDKPRPTRSHDTRAASTAHVHWSYEGPGGPDAWGRLRPEFAKCSSGQRQSPIDLRDGIQVQLEPIRFDYQPASRFGVIDNGHTVQVNVAPGNFIETMGRRFHLRQFHFHRPSEERIDGRQSDMAAHLVHQDAEGRLAIVAVLLERGGAQPVVQAVWNNLPLEKGEEQAAQVGIDLNQLLPAERGYFTYMGSLTTPPCSEGVLWMVMKQPVPISADQLSIFARLYPMNARPVQPAAGRMVKESATP
ncbi:MAG TPA: carbonic anhydrase family protein, partial [Albitalea sp.]